MKITTNMENITMRLLSVPMLAAAMLSLSAAAEINNLVNVSWGDSIVISKGVNKLDSPESIATALKYWLDKHEGRTILWRISSDYVSRFYEQRSLTDFYRKWNELVAEISTRFDPVATVRKLTRENNQKLLLYATFNDHGAPASELFGGYTPFPWQDKVTIAHPEYQERDLAGNWHYGVLDLSNPDARKFMVERLIGFVKEYDADGLYLCSRTHSLPAIHADQFGFGPAVVAEYKKRYGIDITTDKRFDYRAEEYAPKSEEVENWRKLRGEYLVQFIREIREAMPGRLLYVALPRGGYYGAPFGNMVLDYEAMISNHLIDGLVLNVISGRSLYISDKVKHADRGYLTSTDDYYNVPAPMAAIRALSPLCKKNNVALFYSGISDRQLRNDKGLQKLIDGVRISAPAVKSGVVIKDSEELRSGPLTVDGWFKIAADQGKSVAPRLVSKYAHASNDERGWELFFFNDTGKLTFGVYLCWGGEKDMDNFSVQSPEPIARDKWTHLAGIFDPEHNRIAVAVDGKIVATKKIPAGSRINSNHMIDGIIGMYAGYSDQAATVTVDELRIAKKALDFSKGIPADAGEDTLIMLKFDGGDQDVYTAPGQRVEGLENIRRVEGKNGKALDCGW